MSWQHVRLDRGIGLLVSKLASSWRYLSLCGGLPSTGLRSLPLLTSVSLLKREGGIRPWRHGP
jgi:hypothetical protein